MDTEMRSHVTQLLESSRERERKIALLRYELRHPAQISLDEMIDSMSFSHGDGTLRSMGHISNKTLYIALNYQDQADKVNASAKDEISKCLVHLEQTQERLDYYVSLLDAQEAMILRRLYFEGNSWEQIVNETGVALRTAHKIRNRAIDHLAQMYEFTIEHK